MPEVWIYGASIGVIWGFYGDYRRAIYGNGIKGQKSHGKMNGNLRSCSNDM